MPREKMVYVSSKTHHALKLLAARRNRPMGEVIDDLVEQAFAELTNPWVSPEGLSLQQRALANVWDAAPSTAGTMVLVPSVRER